MPYFIAQTCPCLPLIRADIVDDILRRSHMTLPKIRGLTSTKSAKAISLSIIPVAKAKEFLSTQSARTKTIAKEQRQVVFFLYEVTREKLFQERFFRQKISVFILSRIFLICSQIFWMNAFLKKGFN
jgi:hypothetical protein